MGSVVISLASRVAWSVNLLANPAVFRDEASSPLTAPPGLRLRRQQPGSCINIDLQYFISVRIGLGLKIRFT